MLRPSYICPPRPISTLGVINILPFEASRCSHVYNFTGQFFEALDRSAKAFSQGHHGLDTDSCGDASADRQTDIFSGIPLIRHGMNFLWS